MTTTHAPQVPFGQVLALAHRAITVPLTAALSKAGTTTATWYVMRIIALRGPAVDRAALEHELGQASDVNSASTGAVLDQLASDGVVSIDAGADGTRQVALTSHGEAMFAELRETVAGVTAELLSPVDPTELETTQRVLRQVTDRAEALAG